MPARFATVDEFLAAQAPERRADVEALRALVREAGPGLVEIVKWNSPSYTLDGVDRLTINAPGKGPLRLILHFGTERAEEKGAVSRFAGDPEGLLTWHSDIRASLTLPSAQDLDGRREAIVAVIRAWLAEDGSNR
ncbi:protein of unknown function (DU1801) [Agromyces sp. CF514]|uniref:DUF1801 domain-containing protein n=1 Tax=Agromyces sp. CF514 TaxID=1881031 RepID=UPI0008EA2AC3|nr:DUF1801 domain-containing protein [Agromyces sp. CF514]SFR70019.1 protein of unknown function (DU1801) [Agromyces sp. CF514]